MREPNRAPDSNTPTNPSANDADTKRTEQKPASTPEQPTTPPATTPAPQSPTAPGTQSSPLTTEQPRTYRTDMGESLPPQKKPGE